MRQFIVRAVGSGALQWLARDIYYFTVDRLPGRLLPRDVARGRDYDRLTFEIARRQLTAGGDFVDVGANAGHILANLVRMSPSGEGWAFEPLPRFAERLRQRFPAVSVLEVALSDHNGTSEFRYIPGDPSYSSLLIRPEVEASHRPEILHIDVRRLDDCIPRSANVSFMKIDVEGGEADVLRGAERVLRQSRPVTVFECTSDRLSECASLFEAAGLEISLMSDFVAGVRRRTAEVLDLGREGGEFYYVASPHSTAAD